MYSVDRVESMVDYYIAKGLYPDTKEGRDAALSRVLEGMAPHNKKKARLSKAPVGNRTGRPGRPR